MTRSPSLQRLAAQILYVPLLVDIEIINLETGRLKAVERANYVWNLSPALSGSYLDEECKFNLFAKPAGTRCLADLSNMIVILTDKCDVMTHMALVQHIVTDYITESGLHLYKLCHLFVCKINLEVLVQIGRFVN